MERRDLRGAANWVSDGETGLMSVGMEEGRCDGSEMETGAKIEMGNEEGDGEVGLREDGDERCDG